jgi:hypothetical protein
VIGVRSPTAADAELVAAGADWMVDGCADVRAEQNSKTNGIVLTIRAR